MAMHFLNYTETPLNFEKFKKNPKNSNRKSSWAFLLSILIYISVFYFFDLSLSTLLFTTKFWFIISNNLILIIATDFGAFCSSKDHDFYDYSKLNNSLRININPKHRTEEVDEEPREKIIEMAVAVDHSKNQDKAENNKAEILETNEKDDQTAENPTEKFEENEREIIMISSFNSEVENGAHHEVKKSKVKCARSNSDKAILTAVAAEKEEKLILRRTLSERHEEEPRLEENEFSRMSDEELNRRVEEFIRRFNREIRLQAAAKNRKNLEFHRI